MYFKLAGRYVQQGRQRWTHTGDCMLTASC
jgi:hypothetical protein